MSAPRCFPGRVIKNRYRLDEVIGKGKVATVFRAYDLRSDRPCALKILHAESARDDNQRNRLAREGALASRLCHQNLPLVYAIDEDSDGTPFLVMELLDGPTLQTILGQQGRLSLAQASHVLQQLVRGVACAHALGVLHRDLKPQNILVVPNTRDAKERTTDVLNATIKIVDFGLAGEAQSTRAASISAPLGLDMEYRAPELLGPAAVADARVDQWSLAVIMYELFAGVRPFAESDPVRLALQIREGRFTPLSLHRPDLPPYISAAIERALSVKPSERFSSVEDFGRALQGKWPRIFRIATPIQVDEEDPGIDRLTAGHDLFAAVMERARPGRDSWLLRTMAVATVALLAFAMPFSWVGGVTSQRNGTGAVSLQAATQPRKLGSDALPLAALALTRKTAAIPPVRPADRDPTVRYPPLRLVAEN